MPLAGAHLRVKWILLRLITLRILAMNFPEGSREADSRLYPIAIPTWPRRNCQSLIANVPHLLRLAITIETESLLDVMTRGKGSLRGETTILRWNRTERDVAGMIITDGQEGLIRLPLILPSGRMTTVSYSEICLTR